MHAVVLETQGYTLTFDFTGNPHKPGDHFNIRITWRLDPLLGDISVAVPTWIEPYDLDGLADYLDKHVAQSEPKRLGDFGPDSNVFITRAGSFYVQAQGGFAHPKGDGAFELVFHINLKAGEANTDPRNARVGGGAEVQFSVVRAFTAELRERLNAIPSAVRTWRPDR